MPIKIVVRIIRRGLYFSKLAPNPIPPTPRKMKAKGPIQQLDAIKAVNIELIDAKELLIT